jgi:hypothetical protein
VGVVLLDTSHQPAGVKCVVTKLPISAIYAQLDRKKSIYDMAIL